jgi:DNA-binding SARP family transcriptional activator
VPGEASTAVRVLRGSVSLRLLASFEVASDGAAVGLPLSSQRVLAFLALHERPLQRAYIAGSLWLDASQEHANASLRTALWRLGGLGHGLVAATKEHLALGSAVAVDVRDATTRARRLIRHDGPPADDDLSVLTAHGDVLPDWYEDWVILERERFRLLRLHALELLCRDLAAAGDFAAAAEAGLAAVIAEPLRESAQRALIAAYLAEGNAIDALRQYRLFADLLGRQLGLAPSARMEELVAGVRRR